MIDLTRKRFKKLLMSYGFDRNEAEDIAKMEVRHGISYRIAIVKYSNAAQLPNITKALATGFIGIAETMYSLAQSFSAPATRLEKTNDYQGG